MELVDGPTLADRIAQGPIPLDEALPIARQIAEALEAAHEHGVIHRDLKPANIKVRTDGTVKVLDFGLAKAFEGEVAKPDVSQSPTLSVAGTHMGVILGTAAYMAPEQAKGKQIDKRADIWAFGCVLYEMLTGRQAFEGDDVSEILASVIKGTANLDLLPASVHPGVRRVIRRCLEKDVRRRFRDIGDVRNELEEIQSSPQGAAFPSQERASSRPMLRQIVAVVVAAGVVGTAAWMLKPSAVIQPGPVTRFVQALPDGQVFRNTGRSMIAISPDGRHFLYNTTGGLFLRSMDGLTGRVIPGTEQSVTNPFFSPDGQWVAFYADNQLKKISITGGTPVVLAKAANLFGASWSADDTIFFGQAEGIMRISADGGTPEPVLSTKEGELAYGPQLLPGGEWLLFSLTRGVAADRWDTADIVVHSLRSGERKVVWKGGSDARYVPTGHLIYALDDALFALPFDLQRLEPSGGPGPRGLRDPARPEPGCEQRHGPVQRLRHRHAGVYHGRIECSCHTDAGVDRSERSRGAHSRSTPGLLVSAHLARREPGGPRCARPGLRHLDLEYAAANADPADIRSQRGSVSGVDARRPPHYLRVVSGGRLFQSVFAGCGRDGRSGAPGGEQNEANAFRGVPGRQDAPVRRAHAPPRYLPAVA